MTSLNTINIRPGINVLSLLPHLNYKAWYALAEFVDNSIQSSISKRKELVSEIDTNYILRVNINFSAKEGRITVSDNAGGIAAQDFRRAFRPAEIPPDATGLSEFGMGMKSAACWFSPKWNVRSTALGESIERTVFFDMERIIHGRIEELDVISSVASKSKHYTEICMENIRRFPKSRTIGKIKEHLASIYRIFLRKGQLELFVDDDCIAYEEPKILVTTSYKDPNGPQIQWRREIEIDLGEGKSATGFAAIRQTASTKFAGLALFRRNRLVLGSADETYRPQEIFSHSNSYIFQRVFGEIHLKGFCVSHTKDGVKWEESEDEFLDKLYQILSANDMPILQQAREYRTRKDAHEARQFASEAGCRVAERFDHKTLSYCIPDLLSFNGDSLKSAKTSDEFDDSGTKLEPLADSDYEEFQFQFTFQDKPWVVKVELSYAGKNCDWLSIQYPSVTDPEPREVLVRVSMLHSFMRQLPHPDFEGFSVVLNIAATMALSEVIATEQGNHHPKAIRTYANEILKNLVSRRTTCNE